VGYLCKGKSSGRPLVSEESVERVGQFFFVVRRNLCAMRVVNWDVDYDCVRVSLKRLEMKPHRLHLVQLLQSFWYTAY
jgi:hypothetical protein